MRRLLCLLLICAVTVAVFPACKQETPTPQDHTHEGPWVVDISSGAPVMGEWIDPWSSSLQLSEDDVSPHRIAALFGSADAAKCTLRTVRSHTSYVIDYFDAADGKRYGYRNVDDTLVYLSEGQDLTADGDWLLPEPDAPLEAAVARARELAAQFIRVEDYQMTVSQAQKSRDIGGVTYTATQYTVRFDRPLGDLPTMDRVCVRLNSKGSYYAVQAYELGAFSHLQTSGCSLQTLEAAVAFAASQHAEGRICLGFEPNSADSLGQALALTPNGDYVVHGTWRIHWQDTESNHVYDGLTEITVLFARR